LRARQAGEPERGCGARDRDQRAEGRERQIEKSLAEDRTDREEQIRGRQSARRKNPIENEAAGARRRSATAAATALAMTTSASPACASPAARDQAKTGISFTE
jgi:hypothetical protein